MEKTLTVAERTLHEQFARYGRNAKEWMRKCVLLLPEIERRQVWKKRGFGSLFEYASKLSGMSRSSFDEAMRVLHKVEGKPALMKILEEKGVQSVRPVAAIATAQTATFWAEKAQTMSKNTLETYVREYKKQHNLQVKILPREELLEMKLPVEVAQELRKLKGDGEWADLMKELLALRKEKAESHKPQAVETPSRHIPAKIKRHVVAQTRGQCGFPGCSKPYSILHHTQRWALQNIHDPAQLVALCTAHERLAHHGLIENEDRPAEQWQICSKPDKNSPKYAVDAVVGQYRAP